ncbi:MAG: DNA/RNA non-specific endonuclease [Lachnospiraceae bacterium]|nr:DNA/RNA non-specific endonuclease [Lachnospiraceae bacterium]
MKRQHRIQWIALLLCMMVLLGCQAEEVYNGTVTEEKSAELTEIPEYSGEPYVILWDNQPDFSEAELQSTESYETYSELDELGRCGTAKACIGQDLMPTEKRGSIGQVKPSGWQTAKYDNVDGNYLYNRCHLIGYQLTAENANEENLITGTRYLNVEGMLPFENMVADYIKETGNHVLYEVTPVFEGDNLVASGVEMEAMSVEDNGDGISFHIYAYNVQPGIEIDYSDGESCEAEEESDNGEEGTEYILNLSSKKIHLPECASVSDIKPENQKTYKGSLESLLKQGYEPCKRCLP